MRMASDWANIRKQLESRLAELNAEIGAYPGPITGCDAQFNHLLEQRVCLNAELVRLDATLGDGDPAALKAFMESCPFLADRVQQP